MIVASKAVYLRAGADMLYAFDKATGEVKWGMDGFSPQQSIAGIEAQGVLYLYSAYPAVLYAFDLAQIDKLRTEGKQWWTFGWQFYRDKARSYHKRGMLQQAIAEYKEAIKRAWEPVIFRLYVELGEVYYEQGNLEAAEETYAKTGLPRETDWLVIGPFDNTDDKGRTFAYPPETEINLSASYQGKTGTVQWQKADDVQLDGQLDFTKIFTPTEWVVAYALIDVISPDDRKAQLRIGSGDGVKVWLSGEVIWTNQVPRGLRLDQDVVPIELKKGTNRLLFKVDHGIGDWKLTFRITDASGQPIEGLRFRAANGRMDE